MYRKQRVHIFHSYCNINLTCQTQILTVADWVQEGGSEVQCNVPHSVCCYTECNNTDCHHLTFLPVYKKRFHLICSGIIKQGDNNNNLIYLFVTFRQDDSLQLKSWLNPLTPKISLLILLTICHIALLMLVWRIWYWIN